MSTVMLTLHYPKGMRGLPIATTTDGEVLTHFKDAVLAEWRQRVELSGDELEAMLNGMELERLQRVLSVVVPTSEPQSGMA